MSHCLLRQNGFSLIELLVVISIIGILASIAVSSYANNKKNALDSRAAADLRNAATAEDAYFADHQSYKSCASAATCETTLTGFKVSNGVLLALTATTSGFTGSSTHPAGSGRIYSWNSSAGGMQ